MIRDFARNLISIRAEDAEGMPLPMVKIDKQTWELALDRDPPGPVWVRWEVFALEPSVRAAWLDNGRGYFNGPSLFLRLVGHEDRPCRVEILPPSTPANGDWRVATSLAPLEAAPLGFGTYQAADYDDLIDHPVEMGRFELVEFAVQGVPHAMAISGRHRTDQARLARDLTRICTCHAALFGELPVDRYLFLTWCTADAYGGLEHAYSTSLMCPRDSLEVRGEAPASEAYRRFLGLCSHEYFHLWNVKRIRPQALMETDLSREAHTRLLWAFEGITSYYDDLALVRSGCIDLPAYLQLLGEMITRVMRTPGRRVQTLAESSFDAWTKFYKQDANGPNAIVSYYAKGALTALALDLKIRIETAGRCSLDQVMRVLWERHGRTGIGVPERGIEAIAEEVSGLALGELFEQALDSTRDLDLTGLLAGVGIDLRLRPQSGAKDFGGHVARFEPVESAPTLAVRLVSGVREALIQNVITGGAGERAGLCPGDLIVAADGFKATAENLSALVAAAARDGDDGASTAGVRLHLFRGDELLELIAHPLPSESDTCDLMLSESASESALQARTAWLWAGA
jgi:predicted metalloprotease with PDZ domain